MVVTPVGRQWKLVDFDTYVALPGSFVAFLVKSGDFLFSMYRVCPCVYVFFFWMTQAVVMRAVLKHQWRSEYHLLTLMIDAVLFVCIWARDRDLRGEFVGILKTSLVPVRETALSSPTGWVSRSQPRKAELEG